MDTVGEHEDRLRLNARRAQQPQSLVSDARMRPLVREDEPVS